MRRRRVLAGLISGVLQACGVRPVLPTPATPSAAQLALHIITAAPFTTHQLIEVGVTLVDPPTDVFDIAGNDCWVVATFADTSVRVAVFWYQPGEWRARVQLAQAGEWQLTVHHAQQRSATLAITVAPHAQAHGVIRADARGFAYADDTPFVPIGVNLGWSTAHGAGVLADYERWFARLAAGGGNAARIWMASWSFGIEWNDTPLGDYTTRLPQARLLDDVLHLAARYGIVVMLCLINHGAFSTTTNAEWDANPYNQRNGGPLREPAAFVSDATARRWFARRVRYIGARYAAFPALWCWEWWNEINWTPIQDTDLAPWLHEMRDVLTTVDPYQHLVTSSWASVGATTLWHDDTLDIVQHHTYSNDDLVRTLNAARIPIKDVLKTKPLLISEVGLDAAGVNVPTAVEHVHLTNAVWAPLMLGMAGSGMYWWWDTWLDPANQWHVFTGVHAFLHDIDMRQMYPFTALMAGAVVLGLKNDTTLLLWIRHARYTARDAMQAYQQLSTPAPDWQYQCAMPQTQPLVLRALTDGRYDVMVYDTVAPTPQAATACVVQAGRTTLQVAPFVNAVAIRLQRT